MLGKSVVCEDHSSVEGGQAEFSSLDSKFYTCSVNFERGAPEFMLLVVNAESGPRAWFYPSNFLLPFIVFMSLCM